MTPRAPVAPPRMSRRIVFHGLGSLGVALALAGCAGDDGGGGAKTPAPETGEALATTDEVPVGGGIILADAGLVLTQPAAGEFKAFSAFCTHQNTMLNAVDGDGMRCPLHGSRFAITDGSVIQGPATEALPEVQVKVDGDSIVAA